MSFLKDGTIVVKWLTSLADIGWSGLRVLPLKPRTFGSVMDQWSGQMFMKFGANGYKMWNWTQTWYISCVLVLSEDDFRSLYGYVHRHLYFICHIYLSRDEGGRCCTLCISQRMVFFTKKCQVRLSLLNYNFSNPTPPSPPPLPFLPQFSSTRVPSVFLLLLRQVYWIF